jgi:energy-coupling factor transport system ATP-binding protein
MSAISLLGLYFSYPPVVPDGPPVEVLQGISLEVPAGQSLGIMGPTGCGKTTLALILAGLAPEMTGGRLRGQVTIDGLSLDQVSASVASGHLGLVFQEPERQLFNMTVAEEIAFGLESLAMDPGEIGQRVAWAVDRVGLQGLEDRPPWQLSGGQQKRLAIASVLAMQPPILVLDEPVAGLDPQGRRDVARVLAELSRLAGTTVIVIDQDAEFLARWADRIVVIADGLVAMDGPPSAVFREASQLQGLGIAVPQAAELAARLPADSAGSTFLTAQDAYAALQQHVASARWRPANRPSVADKPNAEAGQAVAVQLDKVSFTYEQGPQALRQISLSVPKSQFVALVGPNGSGKSTLARHLNGLLQPQSGQVAIHGRPTAGRPVGDLAREVGYVFQNPDHQIFASSVSEEVAFGPHSLGLEGEALRRRVADALAVFGLQDAVHVPPAVLGYGLRRLVTIASVWAMQPSIWVLDEPTTGLDARYTAQLMDQLTDLWASGHTILLITHDLRLAAEMAERIVVLFEGQVVLDGSPETVLADADGLQRYGLRPPAIARLSALLAPWGFPHPSLTVDGFLAAWQEGLEET